MGTAACPWSKVMQLISDAAVAVTEQQQQQRLEHSNSCMVDQLHQLGLRASCVAHQQAQLAAEEVRLGKLETMVFERQAACEAAQAEHDAAQAEAASGSKTTCPGWITSVCQVSLLSCHNTNCKPLTCIHSHCKQALNQSPADWFRPCLQ